LNFLARPEIATSLLKGGSESISLLSRAFAHCCSIKSGMLRAALSGEAVLASQLSAAASNFLLSYAQELLLLHCAL